MHIGYLLAVVLFVGCCRCPYPGPAVDPPAAAAWGFHEDGATGGARVPAAGFESR